VKDDRAQESALREAVCAAGRALHDRGLLAGTAGNLSARLGSDRIVVTPRGVRKDRLAPGDLITLHLNRPDPDGLSLATTEWPMHRACYLASHPESAAVGAVLHTHAAALTAAGLRDLDLGAELPELELAAGRVASVAFAPSGSQELGAAVGEAVAAGARVLLLKRHGALAVGATLDEAYDRMELAELAARAVVLAGGGGLGSREAPTGI